MDINQNKSIEIEKKETDTITMVAVEETDTEKPDAVSDTAEKSPEAETAEETAESAEDTSEESADTENENTGNSDDPSDAADEKPKKRRRILIPTVCAAVFLLSLGVLCSLFVSATTEPITVEVGTAPRLDASHENEFLASLYSVEPYQIDVSRPGEHEGGLRFFGFLPGDVTVQVQDTTPPELAVTDIRTVEGTAVVCEDFVLSCTDATDVTVTAGEIPFGTVGEHTVTLTASDTSGNKTEQTAVLTVWDQTPGFMPSSPIIFALSCILFFLTLIKNFLHQIL